METKCDLSWSWVAGAAVAMKHVSQNTVERCEAVQPKHSYWMPFGLETSVMWISLDTVLYSGEDAFSHLSHNGYTVSSDIELGHFEH
jgi:hypothetical protein